MTTQQPRDSGLGVLEGLPQEIRQRIYEAYFCPGLVRPFSRYRQETKYRKRYSRCLLTVSRAIWIEAHPIERKSGILLTISEECGPVLNVVPEEMRKRVIALRLDDCWDRGNRKYSRVLDSTLFPKLRTLEMHINTGVALFNRPDCNDDVLKGRLDGELVAELQRIWEKGRISYTFDWKDMSKVIDIQMDFNLWFLENEDGRLRDLTVSIKIENEQWRIVRKEVNHRALKIMVDESGQTTFLDGPW